jgi:histone acetyltransferase (RNA polymerase elongator complex component)
MSKTHVTIPIFVPHLGCPHTCAFCNQWQVSGALSIPDKLFVKQQMDQYLKTISPQVEHCETAFFGGSFTAINRDYQIELLSALKPYWPRLTGIRLSTRPDAITTEILNFLKEYHVTTIELGAQSFDNSILKNAARGHSAEDTIAAAKLIKNAGFNLVIQLMPGLPGDTKETSLESGKTALLCRPDAVRLYPTVVLEKTHLAKLYKNGQYTPLTIDEAVDRCADLYNLFSKDGISIIRMGLHPMTPEEEKNILAGPFHSAFGFLVKSRVHRRSLDALFQKKQTADTRFSSTLLMLPDKNSEEYIVMKKENILYLEKKYCSGILRYEIHSINEARISHQ